MSDEREIKVKASINKIRKQEVTGVVVFALFLGAFHLIMSWLTQFGPGNPDEPFYYPFLVMQQITPWAIVFLAVAFIFISELTITSLKRKITQASNN
jgi:hypothetical protein